MKCMYYYLQLKQTPSALEYGLHVIMCQLRHNTKIWSVCLADAVVQSLAC